MLNKLQNMIRRYEMLAPGDTVICAVSGGADSVALLFGLYLLKEKLGFTLEAAHFNHHLRGGESDRDEAFVREFCHRYEIPLHVGSGHVTAGEKGLEAAARDARYAFFSTLSGKIATAHTADDNAETVLMHLVRGTGLKGLGGISPVRGDLIRPLLLASRRDVMDFLEEFHLSHVEDSSNQTDAFLRNRLRHHVMPLLKEENPRLAENLSAMALGLREDEKALTELTQVGREPDVETLRRMKPAQRSRALAAFLQESGVKEPEKTHIALAEGLVFSDKPSAKGDFPGNVTIRRNYGKLTAARQISPLESTALPCPGRILLPRLDLAVSCAPSQELRDAPDCFTVRPQGQIILRHREPGDEMRLPGGTKSLKKLFIDRKIPAPDRASIPVLADDLGVLGVWGIGPNLDRTAKGVMIRFEKVNTSETL